RGFSMNDQVKNPSFSDERFGPPTDSNPGAIYALRIYGAERGKKKERKLMVFDRLKRL
ncbi:hypothetical protein Trydic_g15768, partial [Trypoxylus dichotomus]